ncbi:MAG TPA: DNA repair protein RecO [Candidatus Paceibacterota bacterium]
MCEQAIIIKKIPIKEYDELIVCYTKDYGKQTYQAKSILRNTSKQAPHLDILNFVDFSLVEKEISSSSMYYRPRNKIITSARCINAFQVIKSSIPLMASAFFLLECLDKLIFENEPDINLWNFLISHLGDCNSTNNIRSEDSLKLILRARNGFLKILGYDHNVPIETITQSRLISLQFAKTVVG